MQAINWFIARLAEKSTWAGIFLCLTGAFGVELAPEYIDQVTAAGIAGAGLAAMLLNTTGPR